MTMADQLWPMVAVSLGLTLVATMAMTLDGRVLDGVNVWVKPLKFASSFVVYFATLALVVDRLGPGMRESLALRGAVGASIVMMVAELAYIFLMAGRGERSHFNTSAPIYETIYSLMGLGALVLVLVVAVVGVMAWRDGAAALGPGLRLGILLGFTGATVLTLITAGALGGNGGHFVGVPGADARVLPLIGWSASVGDLRPAHFLALHAMQAVPLAGLAADRLGWPARTVALAGLVWAALTLAVFAQAMAGLPLIRL
jgi:hypothetical protein